MRILFLSNYYTHHQQPLCQTLDVLSHHQFTFLATEAFAEDRKRLGWDIQQNVPFVQDYDKSWDEVILEADVVLLGSAPHSLVKKRLEAGKLVFLYAERVYKNGYQPWKWLPRLYRFWARYGRYHSMYLLSASGYTAADYGIHGAFLGKAYRWGYFPQTKQYDMAALMGSKDPAKILWCGRFLDWKHPEAAIAVAARLKAEGYVFKMDIIGMGQMEQQLQQQISRENLSDCVHLLGSMPAEEVRTHMEAAGVYLFTSDFHEGWGAVLNEAMNSGCSVVASHAIGAVPFLLEHGENGLIYPSGDLDRLYEHVRFLLDHPRQQRKLGENAYMAITQLWNADIAAQRLISLAQVLQSKGSLDLFEKGPCSKAPIIWNHWFKG